MVKVPIVVFLIVVFVVFGGAAQPYVYSQENWKTYINPMYKYSIQYPGYNYLWLSERENSSSVVIQSNNAIIDHYISMAIVMDGSLHALSEDWSQNFTNLQSYADHHFNRSVNELKHKVLESITPVNISAIPGYTFTTYFHEGNDLRIMKSVLLEHKDIIYLMHLSDINKDFHGDDFDRMVNSLKFFD